MPVHYLSWKGAEIPHTTIPSPPIRRIRAPGQYFLKPLSTPHLCMHKAKLLQNMHSNPNPAVVGHRHRDNPPKEGVSSWGRLFSRRTALPRGAVGYAKNLPQQVKPKHDIWTPSPALAVVGCPRKVPPQPRPRRLFPQANVVSHAVREKPVGQISFTPCSSPKSPPPSPSLPSNTRPWHAD